MFLGTFIIPPELVCYHPELTLLQVCIASKRRWFPPKKQTTREIQVISSDADQETQSVSCRTNVVAMLTMPPRFLTLFERTQPKIIEKKCCNALGVFETRRLLEFHCLMVVCSGS